MKIAICVKQVPDSWAEKKMAGGLLDRDSVDAVLNDLDEYAVEEALRIVEAHSQDGANPITTTVISMGPERATDALRKALSMGVDEAILITDPALQGSDALATSAVLAKVISTEGFDLVFCGTESTDARMSVIPAMLAERLEYAQLTFAGVVTLDVASSTVSIDRMTDAGTEKIQAPLPAVVGVIEKINEPRYPSFKGIMAAKKKTIHSKSLSDYGINSAVVGSAGAWSSVEDALAMPARGAGIKVVDEGNGGNALVEFLAEKRIV